MEFIEMTESQLRQAKDAQDKIDLVAAIQERISNLERDCREHYGKLRIHEHYMEVTRALVRGSSHTDSCMKEYHGRVEKGLYRMKMEAEETLKSFEAKEPCYDDIKDDTYDSEQVVKQPPADYGGFPSPGYARESQN